MLDLDDPAAGADVVYVAGPVTHAHVVDHSVLLTVPLRACQPTSFEADPSAEPIVTQLRIQSWGGCIVRMTMDLGLPGAGAPDAMDESPMIDRAPDLRPEALTLTPGESAGEYEVRDLRTTRASNDTGAGPFAPVEPPAAGAGSRL